MRNSFSLFQSHLDLAHSYWTQLIQVGDTVIDATCGNGHDTLKVCQLALSHGQGKVYAFDAQIQAIDATHLYLETHLSMDVRARVELQKRCHSTFPDSIQPESVKLIIYNLGYLPGGDKSYTTQQSTTLQSLKETQRVLQPGGMISITCYPGHAEGAKEQEALLGYVSHFSPKEWSCCHHTWLNRKQAPSLLVLQKAKEL